MQLRELFSRAGRRLWILALIPLLAMGFAGWRSAVAPPDYTATATVTVTPPRGAETAGAVAQAVDSFRSALAAHAVVIQTADNAGVTDRAVERGLSSTRVGSSNIVEVIYTGPEREKAAAVLREAATHSQRLLFARHLAAAEGEHAAAQEAYDKARKAMAGAAQKAGLKLPLEEYRSKASEVTQLRVALVNAEARAEVANGPVEDALGKAEAELSVLAGKVAELDGPQYDLERARAQLANANDGLKQTEALLEAATGTKSLTVGPVIPVKRSTTVIRATVSAGVVGLTLAVALLALTELIRLNPRSGGAHRPTTAAVDEPAAEPTPEDRFADPRMSAAPMAGAAPGASPR